MSMVLLLSAKHLVVLAGLRCRTLLSGRHERTAVCTMLLCGGPIAGCSAVLPVRRYCIYRSLVCAFTSRCAQKQVEKRNGEQKKKGKQNRSTIGRKTFFFCPQLRPPIMDFFREIISGDHFLSLEAPEITA